MFETICCSMLFFWVSHSLVDFAVRCTDLKSFVLTTGVMIVMSAGNLSVSALPGTCIALTNMFGLNPHHKFSSLLMHLDCRSHRGCVSVGIRIGTQPQKIVFSDCFLKVSFPRSTWRLSRPEAQLKQIYYDIGKLSMKVEDSIEEMKRVVGPFELLI